MIWDPLTCKKLKREPNNFMVVNVLYKMVLSHHATGKHSKTHLERTMSLLSIVFDISNEEYFGKVVIFSSTFVIFSSTKAFFKTNVSVIENLNDLSILF